MKLGAQEANKRLQKLPVTSARAAELWAWIGFLCSGAEAALAPRSRISEWTEILLLALLRALISLSCLHLSLVHKPDLLPISTPAHLCAPVWPRIPLSR